MTAGSCAPTIREFPESSIPLAVSVTASAIFHVRRCAGTIELGPIYTLYSIRRHFCLDLRICSFRLRFNSVDILSRMKQELQSINPAFRAPHQGQGVSLTSIKIRSSKRIRSASLRLRFLGQPSKSAGHSQRTDPSERRRGEISVLGIFLK